MARKIQRVRNRSKNDSFFRGSGAQIWLWVYGTLDIITSMRQ
jgi:hypothetical protein